MGKDVEYIRLVKQAQLGDSESLKKLSELAWERLRTDIYRLTMHYDLTQEIVQESILEMLKVLSDLKEPDRFWPWLYKIALNKIRLRHRAERYRKTVPIPANIADGDAKKTSQEVMANMINEELKEIIFTAMQKLKPRQRAVLTMRCYREMDYPSIAESMQCSKFAAKMLFYRAKKSLKKQLSRRGFGKGSLLMALILFGKMTATSKAAAAEVTANTAAIKVGLATGLLAMATSKTAVVIMTTAGVLAVGTMVTKPYVGKTQPLPAKKPARSLNITPHTAQTRIASEEYWYYYPSSSSGPVIMRLMKSSSKNSGLYCRRLQDEQANYDFDRAKNTVYINNYRLWNDDLSVWQLPTDNSKLRQFLSQVQGHKTDMEYVAGRKDGLMVVTKFEENNSRSWKTYHKNVLDEEYFRYNWPAGVKFVDNRDLMHQRGWTYFKISGEVNGERVFGVGRIPFAYEAGRRHTPWLRMKIGDKIEIIDNATQAQIHSFGGAPVARYEGGSFFKGLSRPWMGLHTIDIIRRDAAERGIWFETGYTPAGNTAEVTLSAEQGRIIYTIDLEKDVVEKITFSTDNGNEGELIFTYLQEINEADNEFAPPKIRFTRTPQRKSIGILWLVKLTEANAND